MAAGRDDASGPNDLPRRDDTAADSDRQASFFDVASLMSSDDRDAQSRRRRPDRIGDLLPAAARRLGLEDQLRLARAIATWDALVAERVPPAVGACRLLALEPDTLVVEADEPIVAAELRMRAIELLAAFTAAPGGAPARFLRLTGGSAGGRGVGPARV
jgi:predicted nucleic acid-binding Zn ribbon protein